MKIVTGEFSKAAQLEPNDRDLQEILAKIPTEINRDGVKEYLLVDPTNVGAGRVRIVRCTDFTLLRRLSDWFLEHPLQRV